MGVPVSVVVCTRNRPEQLTRCLAALRASLRPGDELVVVDSASTTGETAQVATAVGARLLRCDRPGSSLARNTGWRAATHGHIAFTDDDVEVEPGWAAAVSAAFAPGVDFVTGWIAPLRGQETQDRPLPIMLDEEPMVLDGRRTNAIGASANLAVTREALLAVGGFSEDLGPGTWLAAAEDIELFDRLFAAGFRGRYEPAAQVRHDMWRTRREGLSLEWRYGKGMGARLVWLRRLDRGRAGPQTRDALWDAGLRIIGKELREGYQYGVVADAIRLLGMAVGAAVAAGRRRR